MRVHDDALGLAKRNSQHHIGCFPAHARERYEFVECSRDVAAVALLELLSKTDDVFGLLTKHAEATEDTFDL